jgi:hypothetical protein
MTGGVEAADEFVAALGVPARPPAVRLRNAVLVTGPWLAGCTSIAAALRDRLPDTEFVEADDLRPGDAPLAVVFVVSAAGRLTESDCALLDAAAAHTDLVIGVLSKIDVHRTWRDTLDADRVALAAHRQRYADVSWVGVAAAPDLGEPVLGELVDGLEARLAEDSLEKRNRLRAWEFRIDSTIQDYDNGATGIGRRARAAALRERRADLLRQGRMTRSERAVALRGRTQQARLQLSHFARNRCASLRTELAEDAAELTGRSAPGFPSYVRERIGQVVAEVDDGVTEHLADIAAALDLPAEKPPAATALPEITAPSSASRSLETRLMLLLGAGFGLGVALTLSRLFAGLAPGFTVAATVVCVAVGVALTMWVVATRKLLNERAALDRWVGDAVAAVRATADQSIATRVVDAERDWTTVLIEQGEARDARITDGVRAVDAELREHAMAGARAVAARDREVPDLQRALAALHEELRGGGP